MTDFIETEHFEAQTIWELYGALIDEDFNAHFTAKEVAQKLQQPKRTINQALHRLVQEKALELYGKTHLGAKIYRLSLDFFSK